MKIEVAVFIDKLVQNKIINEGKEIIIFGANASGSIIINDLLERNIAVSRVLDNNNKLRETLFLEIPVFKPEQCLQPKN